MNHARRVFLYELRRNLRRKGYLFTTFGIPLLAVVLLLGYQFITSRTGEADAGDAPPPEQTLLQQFDFENVGRAGYVDLSGMFDDPGRLAPLLTPYPDEAAARAALDAGEIPMYYRIAPDFLDTGDVTIVQPRLNFSQLQTDPIERMVLNTLSQDVDADVFQRLVNPTNFDRVNLDMVNASGETPDEGTSFAVIYIFVIALMLSLFTTNGYLMQSVIEEKETRLIEILIATVRPAQLLAGKIFAMGLLGLVQILVWIGGVFLLANLAGQGVSQAIGVLATIANITIPPEIVLLLLVYFVLSYFMFAGFYAIVGAISNSMREGPQYAVIFTLPAVIPLYFISLFTTMPDGTLPVILSLIPITAPVAMTSRLVIATVPAWQIALSLALLALTTIAVMWIAGRLFRVQVLLAGQMPKLREIPRLLKG